MSDIADLFAKDPLEGILSEAELDQIIEHYRKNRVNFNSAQARTTNVKQSKKLLAAEEKASALGLDLGKIEI